MPKIVRIRTLVNKLRKEVEQDRKKLFEDLYKKYRKAYGHRFDAPQVKQLFEQACWFYVELTMLQNEIEVLWKDDRKKYFAYMRQIEKLISIWKDMLSNLGITWTRTPYLEKEKREVQKASEIAKIENKARAIIKNRKMKEEREHAAKKTKTESA